ncbi:S-layer homology domain-containing protein [Lysinibacillus fusiformis]|uniref:S-layer homology domain-containing protein n=1 Tax=Lysinibacillus fusiformis TaxID=28031 RepID=UPI0011BB7630|nr:S-layer homology domain-containing protein [Lysinibacillus fusiformis]QDZ98842.1 S-layer homology domain-containing protein [Lysinibacillus fusiformis]
MKKITSVFLMVCMLIVLATPNVHAFSDVKINQEQGRAIESLAVQGIINGYMDGTFKPNDIVTRGQVAKMISIASNLDLQNVKDPRFTDVSTTHPFYNYIAVIANMKIINGNDGKYKPNDKLTKGQLSKILVNAFDLRGGTPSPFKDANKSSFKEYIDILYHNSIINGLTKNENEYGVNDPVTRGQLATFIHRAQKKSNPNILNGEWNGHYFQINGDKTSLNLIIDQEIGVFTFTDSKGVTGVNVGKVNYDSNTGIFSVKDKKWYNKPNDYTLNDWEGVLTPNKYLAGFTINNGDVRTFELQNVKSYPEDISVYLDGEWTGTADSKTDGNQSAKYSFNNVSGTYEFGPTKKSPSIPIGSYEVTLELSESGLFNIVPGKWINQPSNYISTNGTAVISNTNYILGYRGNDVNRRFLVQKME